MPCRAVAAPALVLHPLIKNVECHDANTTQNGQKRSKRRVCRTGGVLVVVTENEMSQQPTSQTTHEKDRREIGMVLANAVNNGYDANSDSGK